MLSERQQNHLFKRLSSSRLNNTCADCYVKGATWTSVDFGVFICINCSGCHRSFGMHITRVRSTKLDSWNREDAKIMELVGNEVANAFYLQDKNKKFLQGSPLTFGSTSNRRDHIKKKYVDKVFARKDLQVPVEFVKENNYSLTKANLRAKYLEETAQVSQKTSKVTPNKKKPISLKGLSKKKTPKPETSNNNLLDFDLDITPAQNAPQDLWNFSSKPTQVKKEKNSNDNLLDFNFGNAPQTVQKASPDLFGVRENTSNGFPKPPSKNNQTFNTNPTFGNNLSNDKYNCLSFNPQPPANRNYFYSNQAPNGNTSNKNLYSNGMANGSQKNMNANGWGIGMNMKKATNKVQDKYDVFDLCLNNNRNGYFN